MPTDLQRLAPYLEDIKRAADAEGVDRAILCGVALRESIAGAALVPAGHIGWGDNGHGFGLFQADDHTKQAFIHSPEALTVAGQARCAAAELAANRRILAAAFPRLPQDLVLRGSIAAYNARLGAVAMKLQRGEDPDSVTTPGPTGRGDYGADVLARAERLRNADPASFPIPAAP